MDKDSSFLGFIWRRMIHSDHEDLPRTRIPRLGQVALASATAMAVDPRVLPPETLPPGAGALQDSKKSSTATEPPELLTASCPVPKPVTEAQSAIASLIRSPDYEKPSNGFSRGNASRIRLSDLRISHQSTTSVEDDTTSVNSFKTCPSELSLGGPMASHSLLVPRQVSDNYDTRILGLGGKTSPPVRPADPTRVITRGNAYAADPPPIGRSRTPSTSSHRSPSSVSSSLPPVSENPNPVITRQTSSVRGRRKPSESQSRQSSMSPSSSVRGGQSPSAASSVGTSSDQTATSNVQSHVHWNK